MTQSHPVHPGWVILFGCAGKTWSAAASRTTWSAAASAARRRLGFFFATKGGVALRLPPHSKTRKCNP